MVWAWGHSQKSHPDFSFLDLSIEYCVPGADRSLMGKYDRVSLRFSTHLAAVLNSRISPTMTQFRVQTMDT